MIETWSKGPADDNMPESLLVETLGRVRQHPWWSARAKLALELLRRHGAPPPSAILDVGCGWGVNLAALEEARYEAAGLDISRRILELIDQPRRRLIEADLNQPVPERTRLFQGLLLLDVIEHLDDDRAIIKSLARLAAANAVLVVSVPALPELFSEFDDIQGHRRRYVPETLRAAFTGSGFTVKSLFWWGAWMVPVLRRMRAKPATAKGPAHKTYADYLRLPPWPAPLLMRVLYAWDHRRALSERLRTGTSLFAVATRDV
jgi:SAM-dependent methyltransferase